MFFKNIYCIKPLEGLNLWRWFLGWTYISCRNISWKYFCWFLQSGSRRWWISQDKISWDGSGPSWWLQFASGWGGIVLEFNFRVVWVWCWFNCFFILVWTLIWRTRVFRMIVSQVSNFYLRSLKKLLQFAALAMCDFLHLWLILIILRTSYIIEWNYLCV